MQTQSGLDLITDALVELEVYDPGEPISDDDQAKGLLSLNRLIDTTSAKKARIFTSRIDLLTLTINKQKYTIGQDPAGVATADFDIDRPVRITRANCLITTDVRRPMDIIDDAEWARIRFQNVSGPPRKVYNDGGFVTGFATLHFYPIPDQTYQYEQYSWQQNATLATIDDAIDYPPGYSEFWLYSLIIRLARPFGREPSPTHIELLRQAIETITVLNCKAPKINADEVTGGRDGAGLYDWSDGQMS